MSTRGRWVFRCDMAWKPEAEMRSLLRMAEDVVRLTMRAIRGRPKRTAVWRKGMTYKLETYQWIPAKRDNQRRRG